MPRDDGDDAYEAWWKTIAYGKGTMWKHRRTKRFVHLTEYVLVTDHVVKYRYVRSGMRRSMKLRRFFESFELRSRAPK
jgi:hypothetical protein